MKKSIPTDYAIAQQIYNEAYHDVEVEQFGTWNQALQDKIFQKAWNKPGFRLIVNNGNTCGFIVVEDRAEGLFIYEIVIHPDYQGIGIGSLLIKQVQETAKLYKKSVGLEVLKKNSNAKRLYSKLGFEDIGESLTHYQMTWSFGLSDC